MKRREDRIGELRDELKAEGMEENTATKAASVAVFHGYEKRKRGHWVRDESYKGTSKEIYRCSCCSRWQSVKKGGNKLTYMRYCSYCGAMMTEREPL